MYFQSQFENSLQFKIKIGFIIWSINFYSLKWKFKAIFEITKAHIEINIDSMLTLMESAIFY